LLLLSLPTLLLLLTVLLLPTLLLPPPPTLHEQSQWTLSCFCRLLVGAHVSAALSHAESCHPPLAVLPRTQPFAVRVGYPCFGTPRRVNGKIVGYPAWGRYRVHNL